MVSVLALSRHLSVPPLPKREDLAARLRKKKREIHKKCKIGCVLVQNVVSYKGVQK